MRVRIRRVCRKCRKPFILDEKYCVNCGAKLGKGGVQPYIVKMTACLYGPPIEEYVCSSCGHAGESIGRNYKISYCPECGSKL